VAIGAEINPERSQGTIWTTLEGETKAPESSQKLTTTIVARQPIGRDGDKSDKGGTRRCKYTSGLSK